MDGAHPAGSVALGFGAVIIKFVGAFVVDDLRQVILCVTALL